MCCVCSCVFVCRRHKGKLEKAGVKTEAMSEMEPVTAVHVVGLKALDVLARAETQTVTLVQVAKPVPKRKRTRGGARRMRKKQKKK